MAKPLIGITGRRWPASAIKAPLPATFQQLHFDLHFTDYPASVAAAGGLPVELARDADPVGIIERLDGLIMTGGADVDPSLYGEEPDEDLGSLERERDDWEMALFAAARERNLPVLGICRGAQLANVALGGSLKQHVEMSDGAGHPAWDSDAHNPVHGVSVSAGSTLSQILPGVSGVNSLHHQTIERLGTDVVVTATAPDGVVEAIEIPGAPFVGVQWHPELLPSPDPTFVWLVDEAEKYRVNASRAR